MVLLRILVFMRLFPSHVLDHLKSLAVLLLELLYSVILDLVVLFLITIELTTNILLENDNVVVGITARLIWVLPLVGTALDHLFTE